MKFVRIAGRYEEEYYGATNIGYASQSYRESTLGSGYMFPDETTKAKEWSVNANRIEGWRRTRSYRYWREVSFSLRRGRLIVRRMLTTQVFAGLSSVARFTICDPLTRCSTSVVPFKKRKVHVRGRSGSHLSETRR